MKFFEFEKKFLIAYDINTSGNRKAETVLPRKK
jgi:hypothetical protein